MAEISKTPSLNLAALYPGGKQIDSLLALAQQGSGVSLQPMNLNGVSVRSDMIAVASSASFTAQVNELRQAAATAAQGVSTLDVADTALSSIQSRLSQLAVLADTASGTSGLSDSQRALLQAQFDDLKSQINSLAGAASFNGTALLQGDPSSPGSPLKLSFKVGSGSGSDITVSLNPADTASLSANLASASLQTQSGAEAAVTAVSDAQDALGTIQAAVRGARAQFASVTGQASQDSAVVETARQAQVTPQVAVDLSQMLAKKVEDQGGVPTVQGAEQLLQTVLLRDLAVSSPTGAPASGSDGIEAFGGKAAGAPALPPSYSNPAGGSSSSGGSTGNQTS